MEPAPSSPSSSEGFDPPPCPPAPHRPFITIHEEAGLDLPHETADRYAVLRLTDLPIDIPRLAQIASAAEGEAPRRIARRLYANRGIIARDLPRIKAERLQRELRAHGLASTIVPQDHRPAPPTSLDAAAWDDIRIQVVAKNGGSSLLWSAPFLFLAARVGSREFLDIFVNRRVTLRAEEITSLTWIDSVRGRRIPADLGDLARAVLRFRTGAAINEGVHVLAKRGSWGWLHFRDADDYKDYAFWIYNLVLSQVPIRRL